MKYNVGQLVKSHPNPKDHKGFGESSSSFKHYTDNRVFKVEMVDKIYLRARGIKTEPDGSIPMAWNFYKYQVVPAEPLKPLPKIPEVVVRSGVIS